MKQLMTITLLLSMYFSHAQNPIPVLRAKSGKLSYRDGKLYRENTWSISPHLKPDIYTVQGSDKKGTIVSFISDIDSIGFLVKKGDKIRFVVLQEGKDSAFTEIHGSGYAPMVTFTKKYKRNTNGKTLVELPRMYELVNIIIALTEYARNDKWLVKKETPYYQSMSTYFEPYKNESIIKIFDSLLNPNASSYAVLKMGAYSFQLNEKNEISEDEIFHGVWSGRSRLYPYVGELEKFAKKTNFSMFYNQHQSLYDAQISFFRDSIGVSEMITWLKRQFPKAPAYNVYKIIFSPLVYGSQSAASYITDTFKEAQAHMNFPYQNMDTYRKDNISSKTRQFLAGSLTFTEFNHSFINPEADKVQYIDRINKAMTHKKWAVEKSGAASGYNSSYAMFNEYMNWALINLYALDKVSENEVSYVIDRIEKSMISRGFAKFNEFDQMLLNLYRNKKGGETVADLYPRIIEWCEKENM